jgi:hypothetical protein
MASYWQAGAAKADKDWLVVVAGRLTGTSVGAATGLRCESRNDGLYDTSVMPLVASSQFSVVAELPPRFIILGISSIPPTIPFRQQPALLEFLFGLRYE